MSAHISLGLSEQKLFCYYLATEMVKGMLVKDLKEKLEIIDEIARRLLVGELTAGYNK